MSLAQQMIALAPAFGDASLTAEQERLLVGKAMWIRLAARNGFEVPPTVAITRAAWDELQAERKKPTDKLRTAWVATLFRLVGRGESPPPLVVRTSAPSHAAGLMRARTGIIAPASESEAVDPEKPFGRAITAAFESYGMEAPVWTDRAARTERANEIVIVQAMLPGDLVQFVTRDPHNGRLGPAPLIGGTLPDLPEGTERLCRILDEASGRYMVCLAGERDGKLVFTSARRVEVGAAADLEGAVTRVEDGIWSPLRAVRAFDPGRLPQLLHPRLTGVAEIEPLATGLGVSPGAASGEIVFSPEDAARARARGRHCILVVSETGPADIEGMKAATGILTARGGMTSHAAVVARITGKPCVAGVRTLLIDPLEQSCQIGDETLHAGQRITIDGSDGKVFGGTLALSKPHIGGAIGKLLDWSDGSRTISVRTNVETIDAAQTALSFGAEGIGLARSEHMFFSQERMVALRRMILSENEADRTAALKGLIDYQSGDYSNLFHVMAGRPVTVRLFDPPLHEFLPRTEEDIEETAASLGLAVKALRARLDRLAEINPMLGHRGVRLAITYPEILDMQMRAVFAGARAAAEKQPEPVTIEIMVPFVSSAGEVALIRSQVMAIADELTILDDARIAFSFGTMIELPRACLRAGDIARSVDFFSFGTNDLTQTTFGISRDDAPAFLAAYGRRAIYENDPFVTLDQKGVGELIGIAIERGKAANRHLKIGICGEHAGEPDSLRFFAGLPIDYVSCSPYRVPVARLTLAQAER